jgi:hypothetical protein
MIVKLSKPPVKRKESDPTEELNLGDLLKTLNIKGVKGDKPEKGVDYFTKEEINAWLKAVTPIKGKHYFDGAKGDKGEPSTIPGPKGDDGKDADEDVIVEKVLSRIPTPKDGKDAIMPDIQALKDELMEEIKSLKGKEMGVNDVKGLETRLNQLSAKVEKNYGGHGGTPRNITYTYTNGVVVLTSPYPVAGDLEVYLGGGRLFLESNDYSTTKVGGNKVQAITLSAAAQADIAEGSTLIIRGK